MPLEPEPELTEAELRALTGEMERIRRMSPVSAAAALEDASRKSYSPPFSLSRSPGSSPGLEAAAQGTEELADALKEVSGLVMSSPRGMRAGPLGKQGLPVARPVARPRSPARTPAASPRTATPPRTRTAAATPPRTRSAILARSESRDTSAAFASRDFGAGDARAPKAPKQDSVLVSGGWKVIAGCAVSSAFLPMLSSEILHFGPNNIAVTRPQSWSKMKDKEAELATTARSSDAKLPTTLHPAALVAVPRESQKLCAADCNGAFVLAVVVDQLDPGTKSLAFGIGLMLPRSGQFFGEAEGTVGIIQSVYDEKHRQVRSKGRFGRRVDRSDDKLRKPIRAGSRICMQLSPRDPGTGHRTLRFFIDKAEVVVWSEIEDMEHRTSRRRGAVTAIPADADAAAAAADGGAAAEGHAGSGGGGGGGGGGVADRAWVAGLTMPRGTQVHIVTPEGAELYGGRSISSLGPRKSANKTKAKGGDGAGGGGGGGGGGAMACCAAPAR